MDILHTRRCIFRRDDYENYHIRLRRWLTWNMFLLSLGTKILLSSGCCSWKSGTTCITNPMHILAYANPYPNEHGWKFLLRYSVGIWRIAKSSCQSTTCEHVWHRDHFVYAPIVMLSLIGWAHTRNDPCWQELSISTVTWPLNLLNTFCYFNRVTAMQLHNGKVYLIHIMINVSIVLPNLTNMLKDCRLHQKKKKERESEAVL